MDRGVLWNEGCFRQGGVLDRGLLWTEGCYGQRAVMDRGLLWTEGCYRQRAVMDRGVLWTGMGLLWVVYENIKISGSFLRSVQIRYIYGWFYECLVNKL